MSLMDQLTQVVASQVAQQASKKIGLSQGMAEKMMPMAMAALMGGLNKNAASQQGAQALNSALSKHDGSLLNNMSQLADDNVMADGQKILGHILGGKQNQTQSALAKAAGVDQGQMGQLLAMAAPALLASLGKAKQEQGLDASALSGLLSQGAQQAKQQGPSELGGLMQFLDQDGDGDFKDDLLEGAGKKLLGSLFGKR